MKKQLLLILSMISISTGITKGSIDTLSFYDESNENSKWAYVESEFITQLGRDKQFSWNHLATVFPALIGLIGTYKTAECYNILPVNNSSENHITMTALVNDPKVYFPLFTLIAAGIVGIDAITCYISNQANRNVLKKFFDNYENNQFFIPAELEYAFDTIIERIEFEGWDAVLADATSYVDIISDIIMRHFESRYKSVLEIESKDTLAATKTVVETFKNMFDGASKFKQ